MFKEACPDLDEYADTVTSYISWWEEVYTETKTITLINHGSPGTSSRNWRRRTRHSSAVIFMVFTDTYNSSLQQCNIPVCFKTSTIISIPKKSKIYWMNNYHPVALTSVAMKVFEHIVLKYLKTATNGLLDLHQFAYLTTINHGSEPETSSRNWLHRHLQLLSPAVQSSSLLQNFYHHTHSQKVQDLLDERLPSSGTNGLLDLHQFAYQANRSAVALGLHHILKHLEWPGTYARIPFIDFSSAFNTIIPYKLFDKLSLLNVHPAICHRVLNFLLHRPQSVKVNNSLSKPLNLNTGCVLSPFLFTLFTNDCVSMDQSVLVNKFSDDTMVEGCIKNVDKMAYRDEVHAIIESILTFSIVVWFSCTGQEEKQQLEAIVKDASRIIGSELPSIQSITMLTVRVNPGALHGIQPTQPTISLGFFPLVNAMEASRLEQKGIRTAFTRRL